MACESRRCLLFALLLAACGLASAGKDLYKVLGISRGADEATIKRNYRNLAKRVLPRVHTPGFSAPVTGSGIQTRTLKTWRRLRLSSERHAAQEKALL
jgi:hypothetical protein